MSPSSGHNTLSSKDRLDHWLSVAVRMANETSVVSAFSEDQTARLTSLKVPRLRYWQTTDFFKPTFHNDPEERYGRLYSFKDIVCLRTIAILLNEHKVPLRRLRETFEHLFNMDQSKWASETLYVLGRRVYFETPEGGDFQETTSPQMALHYLPLRKVAAETAQAVVEAKKRPADSIGTIEKIRGIRGSRPVIGGTRVPVQTIVDYHKDGASIDEILSEYPSLKREDVVAALRYSGIQAA